MPLEAVMILLDNSEFCRNGDYSPSRLDAQNEAAQLIAGAKTQGNAESVVGFASMAGARVDVHVTPTRNMGQIMSVMGREVQVGGKSNFLSALKTAQLVLKNRQNKNQRQRIIMFVGSPIECKADELVKLAKVFKKNNIAVDVINFGAENSANENPEKLEAFRAAVDNSGGGKEKESNVHRSHFLPIPPGPHILSDLVLTSSIMMDGGMDTAAGASTSGKPGAKPSAAAASHLGGVDPNVDPELAMVLKMSYEEDRIKHGGGAASATALAKPASGSAAAPAATPAKPAGAATTPSGAATTTPAAKPTATTAPPAPAKAGASDSAAPMDDDDQDDLAKALAMSLVNETAASSSSTGAAAAASKPAASGAAAGGAAPAAGAAGGADAAMASDLAELLKDPSFLNSVVGDLPGIDKSTLQIDDLLNKLTGDDSSAAGAAKKGDDKKKDDKKKDGAAGGASGAGK